MLGRRELWQINFIAQMKGCVYNLYQATESNQNIHERLRLGPRVLEHRGVYRSSREAANARSGWTFVPHNACKET